MHLPSPKSLRARLVHAGVSLAASPLRPLYGGRVARALLRDPEIRGIPTPGGTLQTYSWSAKSVAGITSPPPVALVHGLNANARYWTGTACVLGQDRTVLALDQRGHGATGPLRGGMTLTDTRADLVAWLDGQGLDRVDLVGHSWGGKVALDFAAAHAQRVRRLVLVDPVPPQGLHPIICHQQWIASGVFAPERGPFRSASAFAVARKRISWLRHAEPWMLDAFDANFRTLDDGTIQHVLSDEHFDAVYHGVLERPSPLPLASVTLPVLLIRATFSAMPFGGQVTWLRRRLPQLLVTRLPGEHTLQATNPVSLAKVIGAFLDAC